MGQHKRPNDPNKRPNPVKVRRSDRSHGSSLAEVTKQVRALFGQPTPKPKATLLHGKAIIRRTP